ncbi:MAG: hypothetical protein LHV68_09985 [Elusimicrobia bacterium]|nr:hypothetical protein [Candidatus Liberimonas magnetica]
MDNFDFKQRILLNTVMNRLKEKKVLTGEAQALFLNASLSPSPETFTAFLGCAGELIQNAGKVSPFYKPDIKDNIQGVMKFGFSENVIPVGIDIGQFHTAVFGQTRSGKSVMLFMMLAQAMKQNNSVFWVFARANDIRRLLHVSNDIVFVTFDGQIRYNPIPKDENLARFTDPFIQATTLFDGTDNYLAEQIYRLKIEKPEPSLSDLYKHIMFQKHLTNSRQDQYKQSSLNRLGGILRSKLGNFLKGGKDCFEQLINHNVVFEMNELRSWEQVLVVNLLILHLSDWKRKHASDLHHIIVLEDASAICNIAFDRNPRKPILADSFDTLAKDGFQFIVLSQSPGQVMHFLHAETDCKICLKLSNMDDAILMAHKLGVEKEHWEKFFWLPARTGFVSMKGLPAFLFRIPEIPLIDYSCFTDDWLKQNNARLLGITEDENVEIEDEEAEDVKEELKKDERKLLEAIHVKQFVASMGMLSEITGFDVSKISRMSNVLAERGYISICDIRIGKRPFRYPVLLVRGYQALGIEEAEKQECKGGPDHRIWIFLFESKFKKKGISAEHERFLGEGHSSDLVLKLSDYSVGVEVELSSANTKNNLEKGLRLGLNYIIFGAKDRKTLREIQAIINDSSEENKKKCFAYSLTEIYEAENIMDLIKL